MSGYTVCSITDTVALLLKNYAYFRPSAISALWLRLEHGLYPATFGLISVT